MKVIWPELKNSYANDDKISHKCLKKKKWFNFRFLQYTYAYDVSAFYILSLLCRNIHIWVIVYSNTALDTLTKVRHT